MASKNKTYELALKIAGKVDSSLGKACKQANDNLASIGNAAKKAGKIAATAMGAVATAAAGVAVSSLHTYEDFQQAMANTSAIAQANAEEYKALEAAAREMGAKTTKTATEAAEALGYMALAGWDTQQSIAGLEPVLRLSEATQMDLARCSDLVTDSMSALGIGVEDMTAYLDLAVQTNNKANTTAEMLMEAFIGCGGAAKTVGADMTELSTALGILANNGTKGAEAGTAMNAMLVRMTSKDTAIKAMKELGVSAFDARGNFRGLETVYTDLAKAMENLTTKQKTAYMSRIAGTNYYTEMSYLLDAVTQSADGTASAWVDLQGKLQSSDGALMNMAGQVTNTLKSSKEIFLSAVQEAQLTIGEKLAPYAQQAFEYLANNVLPEVTKQINVIVPKLIEGAKALWENRDVILAIGAGVASAAAAFKTLKAGYTVVQTVKSLKTVIGGVSKAGGTMGKIFSLVGVKFLLIAAVIGAVVAAGILIYKNWDTIKAKAVELGGTIAEVWGNVKAWVSETVTSIVSTFQENFPLLSAFITGWWQSISAAVENVKAIFTNIIDFVKNVFSGNWSAAWENITNIFANVFGMIANIAKAPINGVISAINWVLEKINGISVTIPDWVPGVGGTTLGFNIPMIPALAAGGIATAPTLAQIGEGSEPEAVLPLSKLADLLGGKGKPKPQTGGGGTGGEPITFAPVFNFYGSVTRKDAEEAGRISFAEFKRLYDRMRAEERRKSFSPT